MLIRCVGVEATIPTSLQSNIRIVHRLQVHTVYRPRGPDIGSIAVDDLLYCIIDTDVEYVPL